MDIIDSKRILSIKSDYLEFAKEIAICIKDDACEVFKIDSNETISLCLEAKQCDSILIKISNYIMMENDLKELFSKFIINIISIINFFHDLCVDTSVYANLSYCYTEYLIHVDKDIFINVSEDFNGNTILFIEEENKYFKGKIKCDKIEKNLLVYILAFVLNILLFVLFFLSIMLVENIFFENTKFEGAIVFYGTILMFLLLSILLKNFFIGLKDFIVLMRNAGEVREI